MKCERGFSNRGEKALQLVMLSKIPDDCSSNPSYLQLAMTKSFKIGDHVTWNSEAGRVTGKIIRKITSNMRLKGYVHHATREEPQYLIKSDKTDHIAIHKPAALRKKTVRKKK